MMPALLMRMSTPAEALECRRDQSLGALDRRHVVAVRDRRAAGRDDLGDDGRCGRRVRPDARHRAAEIVDDDARAARGQQQRVGPPDPAAGSGDDGDAAVEA